MSGIERESECGAGADLRDTVVRTVVFALASFTAWWCWSSAASASTEQVPPSEGPAEQVEPVLFPVVVQPLVEAATPAVAPTGNSVLPVVDAVTTPAAPVLQSVVPVADQIAGPVVAPAAGPAVEVVEPVVEQVATSAAPLVGQVAPAVAPVVDPVTSVMAPAVRDVVTSVADPLAGATRPALRSVFEGAPLGSGLRPSTAVFPVDRGPAGPAAAGNGAGTAAAEAMPAPLPVPNDGPAGATGRSTTSGEGGTGDAVEAMPAAPAAVPAPVPAPSGGPFRAALPPAGTGAVVGSQGASDSAPRSQRPLAVLPSADGPSAPHVAALGQGPVDSVLARFGGRAPVTPD